MTKEVDSYRFVDGMTQRVIKSWVSRGVPNEIPWTLLAKPVSECTVALVSSGGIALKSDPPFDQQIERDNPWYGDPSYRIIPRTATSDQVVVYHLHVDPTFAESDLNVLLPVQRLNELVEKGVIGRAAPNHYSYMGYTLQPSILLKQSVPEIIRQLTDEGVDIVILVPA